MFSGMTLGTSILSRSITLYNQHNPGWIHPYPRDGHETLHTSGCGIFALCHAAQWLTGNTVLPDTLADFSLHCGGRGADGTDRPILLQGLMNAGIASGLGFCYENDGLLNGTDLLFDLLEEEKAVALTNIRPGHIVFLGAARRAPDRQLLVIDSFAESTDERILPILRETVPNTELFWPGGHGFGAYWVDARSAVDYNLLHRL